LKALSASPVLSWSENASLEIFSASGEIWSGGLSGGGSLSALTTAEDFMLKVPATTPNNHAPVAVAATLDTDIEARRGDGTIIRIDGSGSGDEDAGDTVSYEWADNGVPVSTLRVDDHKLSVGTHVIKLVVTDNNGLPSPPAEQTITVVDTTAPQVSGVPSAISKVTDSDTGEAIDFQLPIAYDMVDGRISVTASNAPGSIFPLGKTVVTFTARDHAGNSSQATMEVTLTKGTPQPPSGGVPGDKAPFMDNVNDQYLRIGEIRNLSLQAADDNGDAVTLSLLGAPSYVQIIAGDPGARSATLRIAPLLGAPLVSSNVRVVANDGHGRTFTTLPFRIIISDTPNNEPGMNHPPVAVVAPLPSTIQATSRDGAEVTLDATGSNDPDGDILTLLWFDGDKMIAEGRMVSVNLAAGTHSIKLVAFDGKDGLTMTDPVAIEVLPRELTVSSASPRFLKLNTTTTLMVAGTGFYPDSILLFGKEGISVTNYIKVEEDMIIAEVAVSSTARQGFCDVYVVNPNGKFVRLRSGLIITK